jgi:hypothetical protein
MPRTLPTLISAAALVVSVLSYGCVKAYRPPEVDEPHAIGKVRVTYHSQPGPLMAELIRLNGHRFAMPPYESVRTDSAIHAERVRPEQSTFRIDTLFYHLERQMRTRQVTEQYACGSYSSGSGSYRSTQTRYCTRNRTVTEYVTVKVPHASCVQHGTLTPRTGAVYLLKYDFYENGQCTFACFEQVAQPGGQFTLMPCGGVEAL